MLITGFVDNIAMSHGSHKNWSPLLFVQRYIIIQPLHCSSQCSGMIALPELRFTGPDNPFVLAFSQVPTHDWMVNQISLKISGN